MKIFSWLYNEAKEKLDFYGKWQEIKQLGIKHGKRFAFIAITWELIEDVLFPFLSWKFGHPELIPVFLILHFEPIAYPVFFFLFKTYDRMLGREPWEPDRSYYSTAYRSVAKVAIYRMISLLMFGLILWGTGISFWVLTVYSLLMSLFGFIHEKIWHDSNFGITNDDTVLTKRCIFKSLTYRLVSAIVMVSAFGCFIHNLPIMIWIYQILMLIVYFGLEMFWRKNTWGIHKSP
jgi:hypothetical protein